MPRPISVTAPSRLHFGLFGLRQESGRMYGGIGAMIDQPALHLQIVPSTTFACSGPLADRAEVFARRWSAFHELPELPCCRIEVRESPPNHVGLGVGTQLGLSVAAGLNAFVGRLAAGPQELALSVSRGERSAIGTYGFIMGGLIVERGKLPGEPISALDCRIDLPADWRFVLLRPTGGHGLSGEQEEQALAELPSVSSEITQRLMAIARDELVPAAATADFPQFAESLFQFGNLAGSYFAPRQGGGPYNGPVLTKLMTWLREHCYAGGQSSWGPTLFVPQPDQHSAQALAHLLQRGLPEIPLEVMIAAPNNRGALVQSALGEVRDSRNSD